jgi:hypothetical protein
VNDPHVSSVKPRAVKFNCALFGLETTKASSCNNEPPHDRCTFLTDLYELHCTFHVTYHKCFTVINMASHRSGKTIDRKVPEGLQILALEEFPSHEPYQAFVAYIRQHQLTGVFFFDEDGERCIYRLSKL